MFCGEIILPITPPDELHSENRRDRGPSCRAATTCRFPNSALPDVSLPDSITATQPRKGESSEKDAQSKQPLGRAYRQDPVVHQVGKSRNDQHHGDDGQPCLTDGLSDTTQERSRRQPHDERCDDRRHQDRRSGAQRLKGPDRAACGLSLYSVIEIAWCRPGHGMFCCPIVATLNEVHRITVTDTIAQGSQPCQAGTPAERSPTRGLGWILNSGSGTGCQNWTNSSVAISEPSEDSTSVKA